MPKRVIDFDAMWGSDKLASCAPWAQAEYAWLYGLADACGCFELTNLRVIWGRVAAIRGNLTIERLEQVFIEFQEKGLLFVWEHEGKRYGHWTGSDVPGRLPAPSWRMRLERFAPPVPKAQLAEYMARFARGRAAMAGGGFRAEEQREAERGQMRDCGVADAGVRKETRSVGQTRDGHGAAAQITEPQLLVNARTEARGSALLNSRGTTDLDASSGDTRGQEQKLAASAAFAEGARNGATCEIRKGCGEGEIKEGLEEAQAQDLNLKGNLNGNSDRNLNENWEVKREPGRNTWDRTPFSERTVDRGQKQNGTSNSDLNTNSNSKANALFKGNASSNSVPRVEPEVKTGEPALRGTVDSAARQGQEREVSNRIQPPISPAAPRWATSPGWYERYRERQLEVEKELRVGAGPVLTAEDVGGPEALERWRERARARDAARGK